MRQFGKRHLKRYRLVLLLLCVHAGCVSATYGQTATLFRYPLAEWDESCAFGVHCMAANHLGDDAHATVGTVVFSPATGIVKEAKFHNRYGSTVIIEAFDGNETVTIILGHMQPRNLIGLGPVTIGTPVGLVADRTENGNFVPHLHIGIHKGAYSSRSLTCLKPNDEWTYAGYTNCRDAVLSSWYDPSDFIEARMAGCTDRPASLNSWWKASSNALDTVGQNHGVLNGGMTFVPGMVGKGFNFDGVDDFVEIPHSLTLNPTQQITVEAWSKPTTLPPAGGTDGWDVLIKDFPDRGPYALRIMSDGSVSFFCRPGVSRLARGEFRIKQSHCEYFFTRRRYVQWSLGSALRVRQWSRYVW